MNKSNNLKLQVHIDSDMDEALIEEFASVIAMNLERPVVQIAPNILELSISPEEQSFVSSSISAASNSLLPRPVKISIEPYDNSNWELEWKKYIKPIEAGSSFLICPSWESPPPHAKDRIVINIDPGMAFGTGHHESTRLCLEWIDRFALDHKENLHKMSFLDVGTGSGILAIAAALIGFGSITAIDNDPEAINVARENALKNKVHERIRFLVAEPSDVEGTFDITIANIQANILINMAPILAKKTVKRLVLSGVLKEQARDVNIAFEQAGLSWRDSTVMNEWVFLDFSMVGTTGFEPATSASRTQRSTKLSHVPTQRINNT